MEPERRPPAAGQSFALCSELGAPPQAVLATIDLAGVNAELWPLVKMSAPRAWAGTPVAAWPVGRPLFRSWILLFGVLPVDRHEFRLEALLPGRGFLEASRSLLHARWEHRREVVPAGTGCRVEDTVRYHCRLPWLGRLLLPVYRLVFRQRHRVLRRRFAAPPITTSPEEPPR